MNISDFFRREQVRLHNLEKRQMMKKKREQLQVYTRTKQYSQLVCILEVIAIGKIFTDKCKNNWFLGFFICLVPLMLLYLHLYWDVKIMK